MLVWFLLGTEFKKVRIISHRSAYFQQIEEDVKNHAKLIKEMKKAIASFQTSDMSELITFHNYVESQLEKLTDETQVHSAFRISVITNHFRMLP